MNIIFWRLTIKLEIGGDCGMKRRMAAIVLILLTIVQGIYGQKITKGPYLADISPFSISVRWEADRQYPFFVEYGRDKALTNKQKAVLIGKKDGTGYLYEARLKDLTPQTKYFYRVTVESNPLTPFSFFHTVQPDRPSVRFVAMGDSRSQKEIFSAIMRQVEKFSPDVIISMGDLVESGGDSAQWAEQFFNVADPYLSHIPFVSTLGDHEGESDGGQLFAFYFYPHKNWRELWYSFDVGTVHFVSLDYRHADDAEMIDWFKRDMEKTKAKWKIVFMHRPCYNFGGHRSTWGRPIWPELFQQYHVDLVFAGHSHIYERFYPISSYNVGGWPVTYITTGGAGAELYDVGQSEFLAKTASVHHFIVVDVNGDSLSMKAYSPNGDVIDSLNVSKVNGRYDENYLKQVKSKEELDLVTLFLRGISGSISSVPLYDVPARRTFEVQPPMRFGDVRFKISLSPKSSKNYTMQTVEGILEPEEKRQIQLEIFSRGPVVISEWGEISPPIKLECELEFKNRSLKIEGGNIEYWPEY